MIPDSADAQMLLCMIEDHAAQVRKFWVMERFQRQQASAPRIIAADAATLSRLDSQRINGQMVSGDAERAAFLTSANTMRDNAMKLGMALLGLCQRYALMTYGKPGEADAQHAPNPD